MPNDRADPGGTPPDLPSQPIWGRRFRQELAADNAPNVDLRRWIGIGTIIIASLLDLLPLGLFLGQLAVGATSLDGDNVGSFLIMAVPAPLFLVSVITAVWHIVERRGPRIWRLFWWNVGTFVAAGLVGVVLGQLY